VRGAFIGFTQRSSFFIVYLFIYSYVHTLVGPSLPQLPTTPSSSPPPFPPAHPPLPIPLTSRQILFCPLLQFCKRENIRDNKKDISFLLVEIKMAIQRDS
jgi:hypothetical protein